MTSIFTKAEEARLGNKGAALCLIVETKGSVPRKPGAKMIVYRDGTSYGTIGGGSIELEVIGKAIEAISTRIPRKLTFSLEKDLDMHCGGSMEVFIEPILPMNRLFIYGAGHVGRAVADFARGLDFSVTFFDPREKIFQDEFFSAFQCVNKDYFNAIDETDFDDNTYIVIVTPKHVYDEEILARVARKPHAYLGMMGSRQKVDQLKKRFTSEHLLSPEELDRIDMPIGIRFRAETPREIAVSILARLIDVRNNRTSIPI